MIRTASSLLGVGLLLSLLAPLRAEGDTGRYLVELVDQPALKSASHRAQVQRSQQPVRDALAQRNIAVLRSIDLVANVLVVAMDARQAREVATIPGVLRVQPVRRLKANLDRAVEVQQVTAAWQMIGGMQNAGAGVKIAILDTGIDPTQPGFQDDSLTIPAGYPKIDKDTDAQFTNSKVIAARSYEGPSGTPLDQNGHGTAVATVAAGVQVTGPRGIAPNPAAGQLTCDRCLTGIAPKAWLGNYRVNTGSTGQIFTDIVLQAMNDAVADGMDILNFSFGSVGLSAVGDDIFARAVERVAKSGIPVMIAAGNEGPDVVTVDGTAASLAISAGSSENDRVLTNASVATDTARYTAVPGSNSYQVAPVTGQLFDVSKLDQDGLACSPYPANSLQGLVAFIFRGTCPFEDKINNAAKAGAIAALVYTQPAQPDAIVMVAASATLPATMLSAADGSAIKRRLDSGAKVTVRLVFWAAPQDPRVISSFSSRGPSIEYNIKPDLLAVGGAVVTATQTGNAKGDLYSQSGFVQVSGTSFSAPTLSGAMAVLKAARPGLQMQQYRSLLINNSSLLVTAEGTRARVMDAGTGILNLAGAMQAAAVTDPVSLSFGIQSGAGAKALAIANVGTASDTFTISVDSQDSVKAVLSATTVKLAPGASQTIQVSLTGASAPGEYQGFVTIQSSSTNWVSRVAYWYGIPSTVPAFVSLADVPDSDKPGASVDVLFRITDSSGISLAGPTPVVTAVSGGGSVLNVDTAGLLYPGLWVVTVKLGLAEGDNVFQIHAGGVDRNFTVTGSTAIN